MDRLICLMAIIFLIASNAKKEITLNELYGTYEHCYTHWDDESDIEWNGVKNIIALKNDSTFEHWIYKKDRLIVHEFGTYKFEYHPKWSYIDMNGGYTEFVKYITTAPQREERYTLRPKRNIFGKVYITIHLPMDPDGAPADPKYKRRK